MIHLADVQRGGVDDEQVVVGQAERQTAGPVLTRIVLPPSCRLVPAHDEPDPGDAVGGIGQRRVARDSGRERRIGWSSAIAFRRVESQVRQPVPIEIGTAAEDPTCVDDRRLVSRKKRHGVHPTAVARRRQRPRLATEHGNRGRAEAGRAGVEHLDRVVPGHRDEGPAVGEGHVGRLVPGVERLDDQTQVQIDDAHAVRELVDHPGLAVVASDDADRLETHRDRRRPRQFTARLDVEHLEPGVGRVDGEHPVARRCERQRVDVG